MNAKRIYRDRDGVEVAVLDALVDRGEEGMTVLELRAAVDADIGAIAEALTELKQDDLIAVDESGGTTLIRPDERAVPGPADDSDDPTLADRVRERLPF